MKKSAMGKILTTAALLAAACAGSVAHAEEWSDNSLSVRYGTQFAEPYVGDGIAKTIYNFTHSGGYKYGTNFFSIDMLMSNAKDNDSQEAYVVYRNTIDFSKVGGKDLAWGPARSFGATVGFDWNTKNDPGYSSRKRMYVAGPTVMMDVPGFLNISVLALWESNQPVNSSNVRIARYEYRTHPMLDLAWGIPIGDSGFSFEGYCDYIAAKGTDEFGDPTSPELNFDGQIMYDLGSRIGMGKNTFRVGLEYQYWRNKFGNPDTVPGSFAKTPMVRAEYHF
ncbi:nucleoside-specific outer membrane channel protein Tsx [Herbaspirillum sp. Sphag1AN]|uniref:outer envelope protein n=1 Tax=unclassified Herbaspirillum TaxID=2624150 RepID=UPI0016118AD2|nr:MULTISPECIES: outer envelope protein [unclassified Herbaspirillum]MBB3212547.1 nucleoside-specific outer membrane channel protein Tsx [Herbaspirillum sp. Sphag1AN]MBB3245744.1 nucleoside-specific outer membrane channel protein Tsx [Herbaspirillum sp. Sphag64]